MTTPLLRKSVDIGIVGNKSTGKTITMSAIGFFFYLMGYKIFSNYHLKYPHIRIKSIEDLQYIYKYPQSMKKIMLMEDFERWVNSRLASSNSNITISQITMDNGKNNCSLVWTAKRTNIVDISIRDTTDLFLETKLIMPYNIETGNKEIDDFIKATWSEDLEMLCVELKIYDTNLKQLPTIYLFNLKFFGSLYDTQEIVKNL